MGCQYRFGGVSAAALTLALCAPAVAFAQAAEQSVDEIVVTGSRIATTGYRQPTPVTVVNEVQLQRDAKVSIGDTIRELPSVGTSGSPNNGVGANNIVGGITGLDTVNLRQLGTNRTLVLLDSQRVVASNITGVVDLGTMPTMLVRSGETSSMQLDQFSSIYGEDRDLTVVLIFSAQH